MCVNTFKKLLQVHVIGRFIIAANDPQLRPPRLQIHGFSYALALKISISNIELVQKIKQLFSNPLINTLFLVYLFVRIQKVSFIALLLMGFFMPCTKAQQYACVVVVYKSNRSFW